VSVVVDPVHNPKEYQNMLIDLVGEDDPLEVQEQTAG
jgi:hypothetical protein